MNSKRVIVAMSGGVDSSVAAALLKDRGFEVIGITMQIWEHSKDWSGCCGLEAIEDARMVANKLGIPHYVLNFRDIFREKVIDNFCEEYKSGRTPNPCIRCNQHIKFGTLIKKAKELSADYIATGHYARIEYDNQTRMFFLKKGVDSQKDQSYVLYIMTQEQLSQTLMPLGTFTKDQVRQIARERDLHVADKSESQEICFISNDNYGDFLKKYVPDGIPPGPIINKDGKVIGTHRGIIFYTIGQRKGIGIANKEPLYVTRIDRGTNTITVGKKEDIYSNELVVDNVNFIDIEKLTRPMKVEAKIRYRHEAQPAWIFPLNRDRVQVRFDEPQWAITPGQAVVFYLNDGSDIVMGGGTIV